MTLQITGKNLDLGASLRSYLTEKVEHTLDKYVGSGHSGHVRIEKEHGEFRTDCSLQLTSGIFLQAHGTSHDVYASADNALERLEKRLRRYKRRLKSHSGAQNNNHFEVADYILGPGEDANEAGETPAPIIIAEQKSQLRQLSVSDAVMQLDLQEEPFLLFRNAAHGGINIIHRREDGNIGWIDPEIENAK